MAAGARCGADDAAVAIDTLLRMPEPKRRMPAVKRRALILEVAREAFLEADEGMGGVSTRVIAERCEIDEALIYRHFGTKENLYFEAVAQPVEEVIARFVERVRAVSTSELPSEQIERERDLTYQFFVWVLEMPADIIRAVGLLLSGDRDRAAAFFARTFTPALHAFETLVESELPNWTHFEFSVPLSVRASLATAFWLVVEDDLGGRSLDRDVAARDLSDLLIYGMTNRDIG
jgi:AcrR family transcriptional regulator